MQNPHEIEQSLHERDYKQIDSHRGAAPASTPLGYSLPQSLICPVTEFVKTPLRRIISEREMYVCLHERENLSGCRPLVVETLLILPCELSIRRVLR